jgi:hypothetical protein
MLGALLAACGGSDRDDSVAMTPPPPPPPASGGGAPPTDKFTVQVASLAASASDEAEPAAVDDTAATMPEDTEPQAVP